MLLAGKGLPGLAETLFLQGGEAAGGADGLVEGTEFLFEFGGVAVHLEVDGGGLGGPVAAEAPFGSDDLVHEEALEGAYGIPEGEVIGLNAAVFGVGLIPEDEDAGMDAVGDGVPGHSCFLSSGHGLPRQCQDEGWVVQVCGGFGCKLLSE
jgi:hypothetical protein